MTRKPSESEIKVSILLMIWAAAIIAVAARIQVR